MPKTMPPHQEQGLPSSSAFLTSSESTSASSDHPMDVEQGRLPAAAAAPDAAAAPYAAPAVAGGGKTLRWTRVSKAVEIKDVGGGLLRGSIAGSGGGGAAGGGGETSPAASTPPVASGADVDSFGPASPPSPSGEPSKPPTSSSSSSTNKNTKTILRGVTGAAYPGQVLALMGPSGSGKTSILDVLSGRSSYDSGTITLDSELVTDRVMKKMKKRVAYVRQNDLFFGHLTVRDQLTYTALLRLPSSWAKAAKVAEVDRIIRQLRLEKCANSPIFTISGGERKRVNIGTELLTDPSIILLDEPTSGLDSTSAVALMSILHKLAREDGKTIVTSIHQPSSAVFFGFDKLMLLADGNVVYFGTPRGSLTYVRELGLECPSGYNAADHHMDLLVVDSAIEVDDDDDGEEEEGGVDEEEPEAGSDEFAENAEGTTAAGLRRRKGASASAGGAKRRRTTTTGGTTTKRRLVEAWDAEASALRMEAEDAAERLARFGTTDASAASHPGPGGLRGSLSRRLSSSARNDSSSDVRRRGSLSIVETEKSFHASWWTQYVVLVHRSMKNSRSAIFTKLNLIKAGAIGFMCGLLWFQMPYTEGSVYDRSSYYFFTMTFWVFDSMFTAYMAFPLEQAIIFKERASGSYHLSAYFMAKTTSEAPARLALPAIYMVISYWMSGVNNNFGVFVGSTMCSLLSVLAGESIGLFLGAAVLDVERGMVVMTVSALSLMVVGGFFVRNVPSWIMWLGYFSPFKYSYNSSVQLVFNEPVPCDGSGVLAACDGGSTGYASQQDVLDFLGVEFSAGQNAALLLLMFVAIRVMAFFALKCKRAEERTQ